MRRPKLCILAIGWPISGAPAGGVGRYTYRLTGELVGLLDMDVHVVALHNALPLEGVTFHELEWAGDQASRFYRLPFQAAKVVERLGADLVHSHGDDWACRHRKIVRTFYGTALGEARSSSGLRRANHMFLTLLEFRSAQHAAVRVAIGPDSERLFRAHLVVPPTAGISATYQGPKPSSSDYAVFVGSYVGRKQGWLAAQAAKAAGLRLVAVVARADRSRWPTDVNLVSDIEDSEMGDIIAKSRLLMSPSSYEGFGIPIYEAMLAGRPVVALDNPGSRWQLGLGNPGLSYRAQDFGRITQLLANAPLCDLIGAQNLDRALVLRQKGEVTRYAELFETLLT